MTPPEPPSPSRPTGLHPEIAPARRREPVFNMPGIVSGAILGLVAIHALRLLLGEEDDVSLILDYAVVPARWSAALGLADPAAILAEARRAASPALEALAEYSLDDGARPWTGLTYALLHGSWVHLAFNAVWLAAFGTPAARRLGAWRFAALAGATAFAGAALHVLLHRLDAVPLIGASAAVSGMMGAAAWFMFAPAPPGPDGLPAPPHERPRAGLAATFLDRRVLFFVGIWLATNYLFAGLAQPLAIAEDGIAWEAHVGGFLAGLALFPALDPLPPRRAGPPG